VYPAFDTSTWITPYGLMLVVALIGCWLYARRRATNAGLDVSHIDLAVPLTFIIGVLGAKIFTLIYPGDVEFAGELFQTHSRYRLFGLFFAGVPVLFAYSRLAKLSFRGLLDLFALPVVLWLAILRIGCFMAGCCWGDLTQKHPDLASVSDPHLARQILTLPWLSGDWIITRVSFPAESLAYQQHLLLGLIEPTASSSLTVHPTQLYELVLLTFLLVIMQKIERRLPLPGMVALAALGSYAFLRFIIEFLRADSTLVWGYLTFTQVICVALLLGCVVLIRKIGVSHPTSL
jgi:phosphatidylglycerol:prolipoprotein diacylglycerol transferase